MRNVFKVNVNVFFFLPILTIHKFLFFVSFLAEIGLHRFSPARQRLPQRSSESVSWKKRKVTSSGFSLQVKTNKYNENPHHDFWTLQDIFEYFLRLLWQATQKLMWHGYEGVIGSWRAALQRTSHEPFTALTVITGSLVLNALCVCVCVCFYILRKI